MQEKLRKWLPFLSDCGAGAKDLTPKHIVQQARAMLEEAAQASDPSAKARIRARFWKRMRRRGESTEDAKRRIFLSWPPAEGELRRVQEANLELLRRLKAVCDENGLSFFLLWGTLLGSVRHHGFIPWDDDIDIGMTCSDYARLEGLLAEDPLLRVDMYYNWDYGTVCPKVKFRGCESFWLDIFLFEEIRVTESSKQRCWSRVRERGEAFQQERLKIIRKFYPPEEPCAMPVRDGRIDAEIKKIHPAWADQLDFYGGEGNALMESIDINPVFIRNLFMKEKIYPIRKDEMIFEGELYSALRNTDVYLTEMYGSYMDLPDSLETRHSPEVEQFLSRDLDFLRTRILRYKNSGVPPKNFKI